MLDGQAGIQFSRSLQTFKSFVAGLDTEPVENGPVKVKSYISGMVVDVLWYLSPSTGYWSVVFNVPE